MKLLLTAVWVTLWVVQMQGQIAFQENFDSQSLGSDLTTFGFELSQRDTYTGTVTAVVAADSNQFARMNGNVNASAHMQMATTLDVTAGQSYTFSTRSRGPFKRQLRVYDLSGTQMAASPDYKPATAPEEVAWRDMSVTFSVEAGVDKVVIGFFHYWSGTIDVDDIQVVEAVRQTSYYLSSSAGDDANDGTLGSPWASLAKISSTTLQPGDTVLFQRGDRFDGHWVVNGSGNATQPILITAYGTGDKPILTGEVGAAGGGDHEEAILVENQDHLIFDGLEVQNERLVSRSGVDDTDAYGIYVLNSGTEVMRNLTFRNLSFKNVFAVQPILDRSDFDKIQVSGLGFFSTRNTQVGQEKHIRDVLIEDCFFGNLQRFGIEFKHGGGNNGVGNDSLNRNMNIRVRNNEFSYNGGTGVLPNRTYNCLIEDNLFDHPGASTDPRMPGRGSSIWNIHSINTIMQYNMCLSTRGYLDSHGIHIDNNNVNTFVQYNYMEDCEGGFVEILRGNKNAVYRFNVSVNDSWRVNPDWATSNHTIWVNSVRHDPSRFDLCDSIFIHNNTVVINKPFTSTATQTSVTMDADNLYVFNNIFTSTNGGIKVAGHFVVRKEEVGNEVYISNN
ncbi:MAG: right-handed parallel beta-helix repeat-containing protein, partial [Bacteroidota bacterium]